jgi:hypothetical protein
MELLLLAVALEDKVELADQGLTVVEVLTKIKVDHQYLMDMLVILILVIIKPHVVLALEEMARFLRVALVCKFGELITLRVVEKMEIALPVVLAGLALDMVMGNLGI